MKVARLRKDEKMAKKTITKKSSKKLSRLPFQILTIFIFVVSALVLCSFVFFKTENIKISVNDEYDSQDIIDVLDVEYGENLIFLNTHAMEEKIFRTFSYVENVNVVKVVPSTLSVQYSIAQVCYSVLYQGNYAYVSETGKLLELASFPASGSIIVNVGDIEDVDGYMLVTDSDINSAFTEIMELYSDGDLENVTEMILDDKYDLQIIYDDRVTFDLGTATDLSFKIQFGMQVVQSEQITETDSGTLNLSLGRESNRAYFMSDALLAAYEVSSEEEETIIAGRG